MKRAARLGALLLGLLCWCLPASAQRFYSDALLSDWQARYAPNLQWNFDNLVVGSLTPAERRQLGAVRLDLPLRGSGPAGDDPLLFYAVNGRVVMPVQSVKFFDDLALAWSYAWANQLPLDNVTDYLAMLKYRQAPPGGWPEPLAALGVPADSWQQDRRIDELSQKILKSALVWIMAHEVAHLLYGHPGYGPGVPRQAAQANEAAADRFANEIMRRIGVAPGGMANFFMLLAHWSANRGDFASDAAWQRYLSEEATHPLTAHRMHAIAADLQADPAAFSAGERDRTAADRVRFIGQQLEQIATILSDSEVQRAIAARARAQAPEQISYRAAAPASAAEPFSGAYRGQFLHLLPGGESEQLSLRVELQRRGRQVRGWFDFGLGAGELEGRVVDGQLHFQWAWGANFGQGRLAAGPDGLRGSIGYRAADSDAGRWELQR